MNQITKPKPKIIGHRGARGLSPENTAASILKALEFGVDEVEIDVRITKDHVPILCHDKFLVTLSGEQMLISQNTFGMLKAHKPDLTTLHEALKLSKKTPLRIEVKSGPLYPTVRSVKSALENNPAKQILLASFDYKILKGLHKELPELPKVVNGKWLLPRAAVRAKRLSSKHIAMDQKYLWALSFYIAKFAGLELHPYSINDPKQAEKWSRYGLSGFVTDFPDRFHSQRN